jgi:eukaryotic-like serine/threonine-protein kinase
VNLTDPYALAAKTSIISVHDLPEQLRRSMGSTDEDFVVTRSNSRRHSKVVDADSANLLREFRAPATIAVAVARFSRRTNADPERSLDDALPMLLSLIQGGFLVSAESAEADTSSEWSSLAARSGWKIVRQVQSMEDTELYQVQGLGGQIGALKIGRPNNVDVGLAIEREARILGHLNGRFAPVLIESGRYGPQPFIITEWFRGSELEVVSTEYREHGEPLLNKLLSLAGNVIDAYAGLHKLGVIHGDVHPRNILVDRFGDVKVIDFGYGRSLSKTDSNEPSTRAGVSFFFEPEFAQAMRNRDRPPRVTAGGEQYSLAALLYLMLTGSHYLDFRVERNEMLRQIAEDPMRPLNGQKAPLPEVAQLLQKALSKSPADRFTSVTKFAQAWKQLGIPELRPSNATYAHHELQRVRKQLFRDCAPGGPLVRAGLPPPSVSINYGSAGLAYALCRIASATDDGELLAVADLWADRAIDGIHAPGAFTHDLFEVATDDIGGASLFHGPAGAYAVAALVADARDDRSTSREAVGHFTEVTRHRCKPIDLTLGRTGALLGCALLAEHSDDENLRDAGQTLLKDLWREIDGYAAIGECPEMTSLGIAHGWAGLLYTTLTWCAVSGTAPPPSFDRRLNELAALAEPFGRGFQWKCDAFHATSASYLPGWCNGSAGYVFLWTRAYQLTRNPLYLELAEGAAWHTWETKIANISLCCGMAGQGYALLNFYRHSSDDVWLQRAKQIVKAATLLASAHPTRPENDSPETRPTSLYKGVTGLAVLAADVELPQYARMPMFECEA